MRIDLTRAGVASLVVAASILRSRRTIPIRLLTDPVRGDESIMSAKSHGTTAEPVQRLLRWGVNRELADRICSFNREGAESSGYFTECREFTKQINWARGMATEPEPITFYDSVTGYLLFRAPVGRTMDAFLSESLRHGWPSFRPAEVLWDHVRVLDDHEVVSTAGTHLGHVLFDSIGPRYCINLCSVAGNAVEAPSSSAPIIALAGEGLKAAWPLLHEIAAAGEWTGSMHYATGAFGLSPAPFVLRGSLRAELDGGGRLTLTSSVTLPNGIERVVALGGALGGGPGASARLEKLGDGGAPGPISGPISVILAEQPGAGLLLLRELNATTNATLVTSSIMKVAEGELVQTAHELGAAGEVSGVQMWRMRPVVRGGGDEEWIQDEEAFMTSGSQL